MSSYRIKSRKDGSRFAEIQISRTGGQKPVWKRMDINDSWSQKTIDKRVDEFVFELKRQEKMDGLLTKAEQTERQIAIEQQRQAMPTVKAYADEYLKTKSRERSANTTSYYTFILNGHIIPVIGSFRLDEVQPKHIKKLLSDMQANGFSYSTVRGAYITLNQLFTSACVDEIILKNPCKKEYAPKRSKDSNVDESNKAYTIQEIQLLKIYIKEESIKWQCIVNLLIETGCRRSEIAALRWNKINWETGAILIDSNVISVKVDGKYQLQQVTPKSGKSRIVYVDEEMLDLLNQYACELKAINKSGYIFTQKDDPSLPITPTAINRHLTRFGNRVGFEDLHAHKLRHSFATAGILNGVDVVSMSKLLGHSDPSITLDIYSHANEQANKLASQKTLLALKGVTDDKEDN